MALDRIEPFNNADYLSAFLLSNWDEPYFFSAVRYLGYDGQIYEWVDGNKRSIKKYYLIPKQPPTNGIQFFLDIFDEWVQLGVNKRHVRRMAEKVGLSPIIINARYGGDPQCP